MPKNSAPKLSLPTDTAQHRHHGVESSKVKSVRKNEPQAHSVFSRVKLTASKLLKSSAAVVACDINAFTTSNTTSLITALKAQGTTCVNELFSAVAPTQQSVYNSTIKIRSQNLTTLQKTSACATMGLEETYFHNKLQSNNTPVADDNNAQLQVNIFDSSDDYKKYAGPIFGIGTNNGGMYLEGDPATPGNVSNFVAYEASYAEPDHFVWNLEHEYVHYLDGRFDLYGGFNSPTEDIVWWSEGVAEYVANQDDNQAALDTVNDGSTYTLGVEFKAGGWPSASDNHGSSNNTGNDECIYITNPASYWGYFKISGTASGASIVVDFDTAGCR